LLGRAAVFLHGAPQRHHHHVETAPGDRRPASQPPRRSRSGRCLGRVHLGRQRRRAFCRVCVEGREDRPRHLRSALRLPRLGRGRWKGRPAVFRAGYGERVKLPPATESRGATVADEPTMADDPVATPAIKPRPGMYVVGFLVFRIFNSAYWALVGGLGWGFGAALGALVPWPDAGLVGGALGLAVVLLAVLTIDPGSKRTEQTPIQLAGFGW